MKKIILLISFFIAIACSKDDESDNKIDSKNFKEFSKLDFKKFIVNTEISYWDINEECFDKKTELFSSQIIESNGIQSGNFDTKFGEIIIEVDPNQKFLGFCQLCCVNFIRFENQKDMSFIRLNEKVDKDRLINFIGSIDNIDESYFLIRNSEYKKTLTRDKPVLFKLNDNSFEFILEKEISLCEPYLVEKHHIRVESNGEIIVLNKEVVINENSCINF